MCNNHKYCLCCQDILQIAQKVTKKRGLARKFPHELVMRKPSERPAVYGSGCEGVPEAKGLAGLCPPNGPY